MNEQDKLLRALFGDDQLTPSKKFEKELHARLQPPRKHLLRALRRAGYATAVLGVLIAIFGLTQLRPAQVGAPAKPKNNTQQHSTKIPQPTTVLVSTLVQSILSPDYVKTQKGVTFWNIQRTETFGPQASACLQKPEDLNPPMTILLYNNGQTSAIFQKYYGGQYSDNPLISVANPNKYLGLNDSQISQYLGGNILTDANGNPIDPDTSYPIKTSGTYDIYEKYAPAAGTKDYVASCTPLMFHIVMDAATDALVSLSAYKGSIDPANLDFEYNETLQTGTQPNFSDVSSYFNQFGPFVTSTNVSSAYMTDNVAVNPNDESPVNNPEAGFSFFYTQAQLGTITLQEIKNDKGQVTEYKYSFPAHPSIVMIVRAPGASDPYPQTVAAFKTYAASKGWTLDPTQSFSFTNNSDSLGNLPADVEEATGNGMRAYFIEPGSNYVPSEYVEVSDTDVPLVSTPYFGPSSHAPSQPQYSDPVANLRVQVYKPSDSTPGSY